MPVLYYKMSSCWNRPYRMPFEPRGRVFFLWWLPSVRQTGHFPHRIVSDLGRAGPRLLAITARAWSKLSNVPTGEGWPLRVRSSLVDCRVRGGGLWGPCFVGIRSRLANYICRNINWSKSPHDAGTRDCVQRDRSYTVWLHPTKTIDSIVQVDVLVKISPALDLRTVLDMEMLPIGSFEKQVFASSMVRIISTASRRAADYTSCKAAVECLTQLLTSQARGFVL